MNDKEKDPFMGKLAKDKITSYTGIVTSKHIYLTGCTQYGLTAKMKEDGSIPDARYVDEGRLEITGPGITAEDVKGNEPGCDNRERPRE